jgi:hypothetical protein
MTATPSQPPLHFSLTLQGEMFSVTQNAPTPGPAQSGRANLLDIRGDLTLKSADEALAPPPGPGEPPGAVPPPPPKGHSPLLLGLKNDALWAGAGSARKEEAGCYLNAGTVAKLYALELRMRVAEQGRGGVKPENAVSGEEVARAEQHERLILEGRVPVVCRNPPPAASLPPVLKKGSLTLRARFGCYSSLSPAPAVSATWQRFLTSVEDGEPEPLPPGSKETVTRVSWWCYESALTVPFPCPPACLPGQYVCLAAASVDGKARSIRTAPCAVSVRDSPLAALGKALLVSKRRLAALACTFAAVVEGLRFGGMHEVVVGVAQALAVFTLLVLGAVGYLGGGWAAAAGTKGGGKCAPPGRHGGARGRGAKKGKGTGGPGKGGPPAFRPNLGQPMMCQEIPKEKSA